MLMCFTRIVNSCLFINLHYANYIFLHISSIYIVAFHIYGFSLKISNKNNIKTTSEFQLSSILIYIILPQVNDSETVCLFLP